MELNSVLPFNLTLNHSWDPYSIGWEIKSARISGIKNQALFSRLYHQLTVTLGKSLTFSQPQRTHLHNEEIRLEVA